MKIAFVSDAVYPYNKGGKEIRLFELSTRLAAKGHDVHIYCMKWWTGPEKQRTESGVTLHAISPLHPLYAGERRSIKQGLLFGLACIKIIKEKFDVVDVDHMPFFPIYSVWLACMLTFRRKKMYATWHEVWGRKYWIEYMGALGIVSAAIESLSIHLPYKISANSPHTASLIKNELGRSKNVSLVPCGIDYDHIRSIQSSKVKNDIIFAGRLLKHKNVDNLIHAVADLKAKHPGIKCLIIGSGPEKNTLMDMANNLNLSDNITFIDFFADHDDVYAHIKSTKVFAFPSTREGFGMVALESIACDTPVVTTNSPSNATKSLIISGVTGSIADEGADSLAQELDVWLSKDRSSPIAPHVLSYDWQTIVENAEKVYSS